MFWKQRAEGLLVLGVLAILGGCLGGKQAPLLPQDYRSWPSYPEKPLDYPIPGHLAHARVIYVNQAGRQTLIGRDGGRLVERYPEGTIIVKEIYQTLQVSAGQSPSSLTAMIKASGHPEALGTWLWVVKDVASGREEIIDYGLCLDCHVDANAEHPYGDHNPDGEDRDYVFLPYRLFANP